MNQHIELHIEELVLHGFTGYHASGIGNAVQREIARILYERGLPANMAIETNIDQLHAGSFILQPGGKAETIGNNIANTVYKGLAK
ncbi:MULTISPECIES: hypothetical protein [Niastella]|uniref:Uncharacterized protein n=1 Tax=Niastella soli TaxID=2821487 RepID=A0ABS3Z7R2_9BACT|nr:hypothetical protein [Niastella soli]MBO9205496.1 hypothetical protein [Niastella soli]